MVLCDCDSYSHLQSGRKFPLRAPTSWLVDVCARLRGAEAGAVAPAIPPCESDRKANVVNGTLRLNLGKLRLYPKLASSRLSSESSHTLATTKPEEHRPGQRCEASIRQQTGKRRTHPRAGWNPATKR